MKRRPRAKPRSNAVLQYKVVELSTVDERSIEETANDWTRKGWNLESVQFAMRESSKRPAMAFVFFTRTSETTEHDDAEAQTRLHRLASSPLEPRLRPVSPLERLEQLASDKTESDE